MSVRGGLVYAVSDGSLVSAPLFVVTTLQGAAQCGPKMKKEIAYVRGSWVKNRNEGQLYNVESVCKSCGSPSCRRQPRLGTKPSGRFFGRATCDNGTYQKTANGQSVEGKERAYILSTPPSLHVNVTQLFCSSSTALLSPA